MLVLSRKTGEKIVLPGLDVVVTILGVHAGKVRFGITAPANVAIYREEVWERIVDKPTRDTRAHADTAAPGQ